MPPLYLLRAGQRCPPCRQATHVYALLATALYDGDHRITFHDYTVLESIERLPPRFLAMLSARCPGWRFDREDAAQPPYLMNHSAIAPPR